MDAWTCQYGQNVRTIASLWGFSPGRFPLQMANCHSYRKCETSETTGGVDVGIIINRWRKCVCERDSEWHWHKKYVWCFCQHSSYSISSRAPLQASCQSLLILSIVWHIDRVGAEKDIVEKKTEKRKRSLILWELIWTKVSMGLPVCQWL